MSKCATVEAGYAPPCCISHRACLHGAATSERVIMSTQRDRQPDRVRPERWLIDTNLWSSVADASLGSDLVKTAKRKHIEILAAPSVLYELLRTPHESARKRFVSVITLPHWKRLMPETFSERGKSSRNPSVAAWLAKHETQSRQTHADIHDWRSRNGGMWQRARVAPSTEAGLSSNSEARRCTRHAMKLDESERRPTRRA